jgi:predicted permease
MSLWKRMVNVIRGERVNREIDDELEAHVAEAIAEGRDAEEARRALGSALRHREESRDVRLVGWMDDLVHDIRYALRTLGRRPGFAAVALMTLALGSGATTVMFTVVNGVLFRPLPYGQPGRLVTLQEKTEQSTQYGNLWAFAYPNLQDCKRESRTLDVAAWRYNVGTANVQGEAEYASGREISSDLFSVLGVTLSRGRVFQPEDDRPGAEPVMILGHSFWQRRFAGNPGAIGKIVSLDGKSFTVVGIAPASFRLDGEEPDLFTPLGQDPSSNLQRRDRHPGINAVARLRAGATLKEAQAELGLIAHQLAEQYPESNAGRSFVAELLRPEVGDLRSMLWLLLGAVSLVLLIACANVASLLLARAISRERELVMRVALGAGRIRLVRQGLTESAVLGIFGGALGVLIAALGIRPFVALWPGSLPRAEEIQLDWRVLVFATGISLLSGLLFGLAPALRAPTRELEQLLRGGARSLVGSSRRLHSGFVISEIALAVVLLVAAGMLGRTMLRLSSLDPGLNVRNVLVTRMALAPATLANPGQIRAAWQDVLERARSVPGVESAAIVDTVPMREGNNEVGYWMSPTLPPAGEQPLALATSVTPDYLKVMGIPLLKGRFFDEHDRREGELVVVIDDVLTKKAFGDGEAVGKRLWLPDQGSPFSSGPGGPDVVRVVGVVGHVRHWGLAGDDQAQVRAQFYYPLAQVPEPLLRRWSELMSIAVRTSIGPMNVLGPLRREVRGATGDQVLYEVHTMEQLVSDSLTRQRFLLLLFSIFAGLALLLACIGIYGVLAYLTTHRVPEIGVRMTLGASAAEVIWLVLRQSLGMILGGVGVGVVAALAAGRVLQHLVEGMQPTEVSTFVATIPVLLMAALFASYLPARRASRIDPMSALRQE